MSDIFSAIDNLSFSKDYCPIVVEIGAADGGDTLKIMEACRKQSPYVNYYAFEPDPRNVETIRSSGLMKASNFNLISAAIGDKTCMDQFHLSGGFPTPQTLSEWSFSSSLKRPKLHLDIHNWCVFPNSIFVQVMRLDDFFWLYSLPYIDFIWCDVQGAEDMVIAGGQLALGATRYFYTECYEEELYEGQIGRKEMLRRLPGNWEIHREWDHDVLFKNMDMK